MSGKNQGPRPLFGLNFIPMALAFGRGHSSYVTLDFFKNDVAIGLCMLDILKGNYISTIHASKHDSTSNQKTKVRVDVNGT